MSKYLLSHLSRIILLHITAKLVDFRVHSLNEAFFFPRVAILQKRQRPGIKILEQKYRFLAYGL